ncbi:BLUF domain-containing protein [Acinetobacter rathckeae]|uniref:BLUF domain-containing protein n=1 Tax=Acinetobacter rathckeae TaxID=2605272 RepID=UPI0018A27D9F|nr:BLUF domain-containing protein [Acinetobacter rathckeae]MBF7688385.1 BLUF domain-containing protein [Acinetobacter rathckeae]MBF7695470.1 BLUF domain-containing protein [Acinetobacter rathckeae]
MLSQLYYISKREESGDLLSDLSQILTSAIRFNQTQHICGVLYYANNCFFQCLEGEKEVIAQLFERIQQDPRHKELRVISTKEIFEVNFSQWSMKYVQKNKTIDLFFKKCGFDSFQPHLLTEADTNALLSCLISAENTSLNQKKASNESNHTKGYKRGYMNYIA